MSPSAPASVYVTSGLDRWLDDQSASASSDGDADAPNADSSDPAADPEADPEIPKRFLPYTPFEKQRAFHKSPAKYRLFGGAAGPGKSKALLMEAIVQANDNTGVNTLLLRRTFPELEQSLLLYFRRDVPRELYLNFNDAKHVVTWLNGSTTRFGYCAAEKMMCINTRAPNFFSSASTSSRSSLCASGNFSPAAIAARCPARFRIWPARRIPATSATRG